MEGEGYLVFGVCGYGWRTGRRDLCDGVEVHYQGCFGDDALVWNVEFGCECAGYAEVCFEWEGTGGGDIGFANVVDSSVVLWVSQNMEDDYAYNLAL